ncbi:MAG TPA: LacI family DNA-binding transcriptional regulator, partial [Chloroflexota bacterium]
MATIADVANRAGVSTMTVSRVVNRSGYISRETRERVEKAIIELGYVPNALARSLRVKQTRTIALVLTDISNPFFTTIARGAEDVASQRGFSVMLCNSDESEAKEIEYLNILLQKQVDGVLLVPARGSKESLLVLQSHGVPVVVVDRLIGDADVDMVRADTELGAYELTRHLLDLGHRRIAALTGPRGVSTAMDRVAGFQRAMSEAGLPGGEQSILFGDFTQASGYLMAQEALAGPSAPSAIFAANNFIAIGAFRAVRKAGLRVPGDVSLAAMDDEPPALADPFLTVASQPAYEMGRTAADLLLSRLSGEAPIEPREIVLPTGLIVRGSTASPRRGGARRDGRTARA